MFCFDDILSDFRELFQKIENVVEVYRDFANFQKEEADICLLYQKEKVGRRGMVRFDIPSPRESAGPVNTAQL